MSADFLFVSTDLYGTEDELKARIDAMTEEEIEAWLDDAGEINPSYDREEKTYTPAEIRTELKIILEEAISEGQSDMGALHIAMGQGMRYFTGGMSWGDSPTEAFDDIWLLALLPGKVRGGGEITMTMPEAFELLTLIENGGDSSLDNVEQQLIDMIYEDGR